MERVEVSLIQRDMLLQPRAELHRDWIEDYALDMTAGAVFPPVVLFFDGKRYWLADGFHRIYAAEAAGLESIDADVRIGSRRDALRFALSANASHGHRRTNEDKRRAVDIMVADKEWSKLPDLEIARICLVGDRFVSSRRKRLLVDEEVAQTDEPHDAVEPLSEHPEDYQGETWVEDDTTAPAPWPDVAPAVEPFDWEAAKLRNDAMEAIRALAKLPAPDEVIDAWMKSSSYGEPVETLQIALAWLAEFATLYRRYEPARWQQVQMMREEMHAAQ